MTEPHYDNPAGRLVGLLESFCSQTPNTPAAEAWKAVLEAEDPLEFIARYARMAHLIEEVIEAIRSLPESEDPEFLLSGILALDSVAAMLASANVQNVAQVSEVVTGTLIQNLKHCSRALRRAGDRTPVLPPESIERLLKDIGEWISEIATDDSINPQGRMLITRRLLDLQAALLSFRIDGFEGVEVAFSALVGTGVIEPTAQSRSFLARCGSFWRNLVGMAEGAQRLASAAENTVKAIEAVSSVTGPN